MSWLLVPCFSSSENDAKKTALVQCFGHYSSISRPIFYRVIFDSAHLLLESTRGYIDYGTWGDGKIQS